MSSSIRISNATKEKLRRLKRPDESFDDLLARLANEDEPIAIGSWSDDEAEDAREAIERSRESFEE